MELQFPEPITKTTFLRDYWQKKPLLFRGGLPSYCLPLSAEELAGLSCEDDIESRMVLEKDGTHPWQAKTGPFSETDFATLPNSHWTLLVQDIDKHIPQAAELLDPFQFIPSWRLDDIMISYATDHGSVGPHIDDYDVFLIQAEGQRLWKIGLESDDANNHIPGLDLRILPDFKADVEWLCEPGDVLYLPPNFPHWGIAKGDGCITCSVGYRAPSNHELGSSWCDELIDNTEVSCFRDSTIDPSQPYGEVTQQSIDDIHQTIQHWFTSNPEIRQRWFGRFITEPKAHLLIEACSSPLSRSELETLLNQAHQITRNGWAKMVFIQSENQDYLYAHGEEFPLSKGHISFLKLLTEQHSVEIEQLTPWLKNEVCLNLLLELINRDYLVIEHD
jgi:50S ribosomal protein L16 3-hydroxylase